MARREAVLRLQWYEEGSRNLEGFCFRESKPKPQQMQSHCHPEAHSFYLLKLEVLVPEVLVSIWGFLSRGITDLCKSLGLFAERCLVVHNAGNGTQARSPSQCWSPSPESPFPNIFSLILMYFTYHNVTSLIIPSFYFFPLNTPCN